MNSTYCNVSCFMVLVIVFCVATVCILPSSSWLERVPFSLLWTDVLVDG